MDTKLLEIGHRLCTQRKKKGLTQDALAEKANVSAQTISHAELGKKAMRADTIIGVCGVLEISADYLLFGNTPPIDFSALICSTLCAPSSFKIFSTSFQLILGFCT